MKETRQRKPQPRYPGDLRVKVVEELLREHLSFDEASRRHGITGSTTVSSWVRIYREEGPEGLYVERRGKRRERPDIETGPIEGDLVAEVLRLRAEVAYLKKLRALGLEKERGKKRR